MPGPRFAAPAAEEAVDPRALLVLVVFTNDSLPGSHCSSCKPLWAVLLSLLVGIFVAAAINCCLLLVLVVLLLVIVTDVPLLLPLPNKGRSGCCCG